MTAIPMEQLFENLDRRLKHMEQLLPTLATKEDLERGLADSRRYALMLNESTRDDVRIVAEALAVQTTKVDRVTAKVDDVTAKVDDVTGRVASLTRDVSGISTHLMSLTARLEKKGVI